MPFVILLDALDAPDAHFPSILSSLFFSILRMRVFIKGTAASAATENDRLLGVLSVQSVRLVYFPTYFYPAFQSSPMPKIVVSFYNHAC